MQKARAGARAEARVCKRGAGRRALETTWEAATRAAAVMPSAFGRSARPSAALLAAAAPSAARMPPFRPCGR